MENTINRLGLLVVVGGLGLVAADYKGKVDAPELLHDATIATIRVGQNAFGRGIDNNSHDPMIINQANSVSYPQTNHSAEQSQTTTIESSGDAQLDRAYELLSRIPGFHDKREEVRAKMNIENTSGERLPKGVVLHWTAGDFTTEEDGVDVVGVRGWSRPEYNIIIGIRDAQNQTSNGIDFPPFELLLDLDNVAFHAAEFNNDTVGVSFIGASAPDAPTEHTLLAITAAICSAYSIDPQEKIVAGGREIYAVSGHEELGQGKPDPGMDMDKVRQDVADILANMNN